MTTLTSANSVMQLVVPGLYDTPQELQGYAADDIFSVGQVSSAESSMGLDGVLSFGWIPQIKQLTLMLQANSPSIPLMDQWIDAQEQAREVFPCSMTISVSGVNMIYNCINGGMTSQTLLPDAKKTLQPRSFVISFGKIQGQPTA